MSLGPPLVPVPQDLVGLSQEDAEDQLATAGLQADVQRQPSDEVDAGIVIGLGEDAADQVPRGSSVPLVVSSGLDEPEIPDLEGENYRDAVAELEAMGLDVELDFREARAAATRARSIRTDPTRARRWIRDRRWWSSSPAARSLSPTWREPRSRTPGRRWRPRT